MTVQDLACRMPERVISATLMATAARLPSEEMWNERARTVREKGLGALVEATLGAWFTPASPNANRPRSRRCENDSSRVIPWATPPVVVRSAGWISAPPRGAPSADARHRRPRGSLDPADHGAGDLRPRPPGRTRRAAEGRAPSSRRTPRRRRLSCVPSSTGTSDPSRKSPRRAARRGLPVFSEGA